MVGHLSAFVGVAVIVIVTPGPDTVLTIRNTLRGGRRGGILTGGGVATGQAIWAVATSAGVAALMRLLPPAFVAFKAIGIAYLVYLGAHALITALRSKPVARTHEPVTASRLRPWATYCQGLISNLTNPKMGAFFVGVLPGFATTGQDAFPAMLALGLAFCLMAFGWLALYAIAVAKVGDVLRRPTIRRILEGLTGFSLIGLAVRLATEYR